MKIKSTDIAIGRFIQAYNLISNYSFAMLRLTQTDQSRYKDQSIQHHVIDHLDKLSWRKIMEKYGNNITQR